MNTAFRRLTYVVAFVIVGAYIVLALRGPQGIPALLTKRSRIRAMEEQNANLTRAIQQQKERIHKLTVSKDAQEEQIRKAYHLQHQGDVTLMIPGGQSGKAETAPKTDSAPGAQP